MSQKLLKSSALSFLMVAFVLRLIPYPYQLMVATQSLNKPACCCCCNGSCCMTGGKCCCCGMQMGNEPVPANGTPCYKACACGSDNELGIVGYSLYYAFFPDQSKLVLPQPYKPVSSNSFHQPNSYISEVMTPPPKI